MTRNRLLGLLAFLGVATFLVIKAALKKRGVILRNREFGERLLEGTFLYEGNFHATYPPSWAVGMAPLALMPVPVARVAWALLQVVCVVVAARILYRLVQHAGLSTEHFLPLFLIALLGISRFLFRDFAGGGPAFLLFTLVLAGVWQYVQGRDLAAGALIGAAAALKVTPGLFVVYFLWKRQWRVVAGAVAAGLALFVAPVVFLGVETYVACVRTWIEGVLSFLQVQDLHREDVMVPFRWMNQSLRHAVYRFLVASEFDHPLFVDFLRLSPATASWIVRGVLLACVVWLGWWTRRAVERTAPRLLVELSVVWVFSALLSPVAWRTYFVVLLPALFLIAHEIHFQRSRPGRRWLMGGLVAYVLLTVGMSQELWGDELKEVIQAYYTVTWASLLAVGLLLATSHARAPPP